MPERETNSFPHFVERQPPRTELHVELGGKSPEVLPPVNDDAALEVKEKQMQALRDTIEEAARPGEVSQEKADMVTALPLKETHLRLGEIEWLVTQFGVSSDEPFTLARMEDLLGKVVVEKAKYSPFRHPFLSHRIGKIQHILEQIIELQKAHKA